MSTSSPGPKSAKHALKSDCLEPVETTTSDGSAFAWAAITWRSGRMPSVAVYFVAPLSIAFCAARRMNSGVSKSGSPAPRSRTSRPAAFRARARLATASVADSFMCETFAEGAKEGARVVVTTYVNHFLIRRAICEHVVHSSARPVIGVDVYGTGRRPAGAGIDARCGHRRHDRSGDWARRRAGGNIRGSRLSRGAAGDRYRAAGDHHGPHGAVAAQARRCDRARSGVGRRESGARGG